MAAAAIGGSVIGAVSDMIGGFVNIAANKKAAKKARDHQLFMYRNRYRMTMDDMRAAGLNPILAASLGGGGPVSAPQARMGSFPSGGAAAGAQAGISVSKVKAEKELLNASIATQTALGNKYTQEAATIHHNMNNIVNERGALANSAASEAQMLKQDADFYATPAGKKLRDAQRVGEAIAPFTGVMSRGMRRR